MGNQVIDRYISVAKMLGEMFAPALEVVVHDFTKPKKSVVFIANSEITGRKIGDPTTDLGDLRLTNPDIPDAITSYENKSPKGHRLKSSSLAIRDDDGELIGSLCLNLELTAFEQYGEFISAFLKVIPSEHVGNQEDFGRTDAEESVEETFDRLLAQKGLSAKQLSHGQRRSLVKDLFETGVFEKRGAASTLARKLNVTRASIYNYLK